MKSPQPPRFAICLKNKGCDDLVVRKLYQVLPDERAASESYLRIIDESGEDYLYPASYFFILDLPQRIERAIKRTFATTAA
jgi:hypothetical protein